MKTIITFSFLIATTLLSQLALASGTFSINLIPKTDAKALLEISNYDAHKYEINISNSSGEMVYYHETKENLTNHSKLFDFSQLEHGVYKVEVKIDGASNEQLLTIGKNGIEVGNSVKKADPVFSFSDNILKISYLNYGSNQMVLHIYENSSLVWDKNLNNEFVVQKGFDISKLDRGNYTIVFASGDDIYEYDLKR
ncbi:MAG TPA: hypothetical protein DHV48_09360 [Prolixibacteraceae bacterium]|nr:hypothetical protein [Prolixibacteraceae bacterium]